MIEKQRPNRIKPFNNTSYFRAVSGNGGVVVLVPLLLLAFQQTWEQNK